MPGYLFWGQNITPNKYIFIIYKNISVTCKCAYSQNYIISELMWFNLNNGWVGSLNPKFQTLFLNWLTEIIQSRSVTIIILLVNDQIIYCSCPPKYNKHNFCCLNNLCNELDQFKQELIHCSSLFNKVSFKSYWKKSAILVILGPFWPQGTWKLQMFLDHPNVFFCNCNDLI